MLEALQNLERITMDFVPWLLVVPGVVLVVIGLCLWLGGVRWSRLTAGFLGVVAGCLWAFLVTEHQAAAFISMAAVTGAFAIFFNRAALVLAGGVISAAIVLMIFVGPALDGDEEFNYPVYERPADGEVATGGVSLVEEDIKAMQAQLVFFGQVISQAVKEVSLEGLVVSAVVGVMVVLVGLFAPQLVAALTCGMLGTGFIAVGMILLLLYKGACPISHIYERVGIYSKAAILMIVFGSAVQMLLCSARDKKLALKRQESGDQ